MLCRSVCHTYDDDLGPVLPFLLVLIYILCQVLVSARTLSKVSIVLNPCQYFVGVTILRRAPGPDAECREIRWCTTCRYRSLVGDPFVRLLVSFLCVVLKALRMKICKLYGSNGE